MLDCSGGDDISEESGRQRKLDALLALLRGQVLPVSAITNIAPDCWQTVSPPRDQKLAK